MKLYFILSYLISSNANVKTNITTYTGKPANAKDHKRKAPENFLSLYEPLLHYQTYH